MPPASKAAILAGAVAAALVGAEARAQVPTDLPVPIEESAPIVPRPAIATAPASSCTPGHCTHRAPLARWRCKRHLQEAFLGFPEEFERPPLGTLMHAANAAQVGNGEAAAMVLRQFDFEPGKAQPNLRGRDHLDRIAAMLPASFHPVVIERSGKPELDEARKKAIVALLNSGPFPVPPERVIVRSDLTRGLRGDEAIVIHEGMLLRAAQGGPPVGVGATSSSSAGDR